MVRLPLRLSRRRGKMPPKVSVIDDPNSPFKDVIVNVKETQTGSATLGGSKNSDVGIAGSARKSKVSKIEEKLSRPITLNFKDAPLYRVLQDLQVLSGLNIVADTKAMEAEKISLEQPLTLRVDNVALRSALNMLLKQASLTHVVRDEVLWITTPSQIKNQPAPPGFTFP